jgi:hypothetical protein
MWRLDMNQVTTKTVRVVKTKTTKTVHTKTVKKEERKPLRFGQGNAKLSSAVTTFSLPAGHFCPFANECRSKANRQTGRIKDGPNTTFRCYAASEEMRPSLRRARWHNADALRSCETKEEMAQLILDSLSPFAGYVRVHVSGDFFSQDYFDAWQECARRRPGTLFYAYTKALPFWVRRKDDIPENFVLTASYGGTHDHLIEQYGLRFAKVVLSEEEAADLGLEIDHDDSHAMKPGSSFALLVHGVQPAGTPAAKAVAALRARGEFGYGKKADAARVRNGRLPLTLVS